MTDPTGAVHRVAAFLAMLPPCPYGCASPYPTPTFNTNEPIEQQVEALVGYYHQAAPHMLEDHLGNEHLGVTKRTEAAAQALFDACGPERAVELGNPKRPPQPITAITNHTFEGQPGTGQRCKADLFGETCGATWEQHEPRDCAHVYPGYSPPGEPPRCGPCIHCGTPFPDTAGG